MYVFGDNAPLQSIRDRSGNTIRIQRSNNQSGNIVYVTSPSGFRVEFTYDGANRVSQATDSIGRIVTYTYDGMGRLWKVTDPQNGVTEYTYDSSHRMLTIKDARGITFLTNEYDMGGRVIKQTQADGSFYQFAYTLDGGGKITQTNVTDPRGIVRRITFNSNGYVLADTRALGRPEQKTTSYQRQAGSNLVLSATDALNRQTAYTYDSKGNVTSVIRLSGTSQALTTSFTYEPASSRITSVSDPMNRATSFSYDAQGNLTTAEDPLDHQTTFAYDSAGRPLSMTNPLAKTTHFSYELGELTTITDPLGYSASRFIDGGGRTISLTNKLGGTTRFEFDSLNNLTRIIDALQGTTSMSYDPNGNLLALTDARNNSTSYTYNSMDRVATRRDAMLRDESYQYDLNGNLKQVIDRKNQTTNYSYDGLNRLTQVTYGDASTVTFTYDAGDRLTQVVDTIAGTITRTYDNLDRLTSEVTTQGAVAYTYDAAGRRTTMTVLGQPTITYGYDNADRLTNLTQGASTVVLAYDDADRRTSLTLPNGVVVAYSYDSASQLTGLTYTKGGTTLGDLTYGYDAAGRRIAIGGSFVRTGLPAAVTSATYNAANHQLSFGSQALTYDLNGNLSNDGASTYTWNARDQLVSISGGTTASFQYDAFGRRVQKGGTAFLYDGLNAVQEQTGGTATANTLTGLGVDEIFTRTDSGGTRMMIVDALGSTLAQLDSAGTIQTQYTYEPFGKTVLTGASSSNIVQFTGRENDNASLYYYRARYYSPMLQRFVSEDPIGFSGGDPNLYAYIANDPVNATDPSGLYGSHIHYVYTFFAELVRGSGVRNAHETALESVMHDRGTQGTDAATTNSHGMAGRKPNGKTQSPEEARRGTRDFIQRQMRDYHQKMSRGDAQGANRSLGKAYHAVLDAYAPGHLYSCWDGGSSLGQYNNVPGFGHLLGDLLPINLPGPFNDRDSPFGSP